MIKKITRLFLLINFLLFPFVSSVYAQTPNQVMAVLCDNTGPAITIDEPQSDSVVNTPTITIKGTAERTSQLDFYVNNQYNSSLALTNDPNFEAPISLAAGTNTIRIDAYFSCNNTNDSTNLVIDYQPIVTPSTPANTDTSLPGSIGNIIKKIFGSSSNGSVPSVVEKIQENLGLGNDKPNQPGVKSDNSFVKTAYNWVLFTVLVGLMVLLFSSGKVIASVASMIGVKKLRLKRPRFIIRLIIFTLIMLLILMLAQ